ncbi:MAG: uroporphyrinogen-III C-methyltransferase [Chloroflexi bacterium]|nr:MAG: uroporphyrinogen-III C-methyltransferase [Chloroflexota bacterium]
MIQTGIVFLVGAGPGDPDLITVKGMKCLQQAEVVVYDRLANPALLEYAPPLAEYVYVGKEPKRHRLPQDEINAVLVQYAQQGKRVVRLKGGDPFVFGRGGEETAVLAAAGIPFEVVPGISSALAVPAYAGIPVTQRQMAQSFTVVTGHTCCDDDPFGANWEDLPTTGTLVILMGVRYLPQITKRLLAAGRSPDTPAATIRWGTTPQQEVIVGTIANIAEKAKYIAPPAISVIGEVVAMRESLDWFVPVVKTAVSTSTSQFFVSQQVILDS